MTRKEKLNLGLIFRHFKTSKLKPGIWRLEVFENEDGKDYLLYSNSWYKTKKAAAYDGKKWV